MRLPATLKGMSVRNGLGASKEVTARVPAAVPSLVHSSSSSSVGPPT